MTNRELRKLMREIDKTEKLMKEAEETAKRVLSDDDCDDMMSKTAEKGNNKQGKKKKTFWERLFKRK